MSLRYDLKNAREGKQRSDHRKFIDEGIKIKKSLKKELPGMPGSKSNKQKKLFCYKRILEIWFAAGTSIV